MRRSRSNIRGKERELRKGARKRGKEKESRNVIKIGIYKWVGEIGTESDKIVLGRAFSIVRPILLCYYVLRFKAGVFGPEARQCTGGLQGF